MIANLFGPLAGLLLLVNLYRVDSAMRRAIRLPLIVISMVVSTIIATLGAEGILLKQSDAWNLSLRSHSNISGYRPRISASHGCGGRFRITMKPPNTPIREQPLVLVSRNLSGVVQIESATSAHGRRCLKSGL